MEVTTFEITEDHLKLLRELNFDYCDWVEFGAPAVDPKRPYGNSDVYADLAEILGWPEAADANNLSDDVEQRLLEIHKEMAVVLQIMTRLGGVSTGTYEGHYYGTEWVRKSQ